MVNSKCYLCNSENLKKRQGTVRDNDDLYILECVDCGLVFLSSFSHMEEAHSKDFNIHVGQITLDQWVKETAFDDERRFNQFSRQISNKAILDFGCGTGGFLIRAKKVAGKTYGIDLEERLDEHYSKNDLEIYKRIEDFPHKVDIVFLFHVLEHFEDPINMIKKISGLLNPNGKIIIEVPNADDVLLTLYNSKPFSSFTYWSPHLFLYNNNTLSLLVKKAGLNKEYIKQYQRYPLANHMHWLVKEKPGGHKNWSFLDSEELTNAYADSLASIGKCDTIIGSFYNNDSL